MKKTLRFISTALAVLLIVAAATCFTATAAPESDDCIADLRFSEDNTRGELSLTNAVIVDEDIISGAVTVELTGTAASLKMTFAENFFKEGDGGTVYCDSPINVLDEEKHPYFAYDYASADGVAITNMIAHYTRKDKSAANSLADLYLASMEGTSYTAYQKVIGTGYGVWDWGSYITVDKATTGLFEDGIHRFCNVECSLTGNVGARITFYTFGVYSTFDNTVLGLGETRPEPTPMESSEAPAESSEAPAESSEAPAESSEAPAESSEAPAESSEAAAESSVAPVESSEVPAESSAAPAESDTELAPKTESNLTWLWIVLGVLVVAVVAFIIIKKKK